MNNLKQKNIKFSMVQQDSMPYTELRHVEIPTNSTNLVPEMFFSDINNSFCQMIDNDKYLEQRMVNLSSHIDGPSYNPGEDEIYDGENGFKWITNDGIVDFNRKIDREINDSIQKQTQEYSYWIDYYKETYIVGTNDGVQYAKNSKYSTEQQWETIFSGCSSDMYVKIESGIVFTLRKNESETSIYYISGDISQCQTLTSYTDSTVYGIDGKDDGSVWISYGSNKIQKFKYDLVSRTLKDSGTSSVYGLESGKHINGISWLPQDDIGFVSEKNDKIFATSQGVYVQYGIDTGSNTIYVKKELSSDFNGNASQIRKLDSYSFLLFGDDGLYRMNYESSDKGKYVVKMSTDNTKCTSVESYVDSDGTKYYLGGFGNNVRKSKNLRRWYDFITLQSGIQTNDLYSVNSKEIVIVTNNGIYQSFYTYGTVVDSVRFTEDDVYQMIYDKADAIEQMLSDGISAHISSNHIKNGFYQKINDSYMDLDFSNLCSFTQTKKEDSSVSSYANDIIDSIDIFDSENSDDVKVYIRNFATNDKWKRVESNTIVKLWNSKVNEFSIHIPTTYTYYLAHNPGLPGCNVMSDDRLKRQNLHQAKAKFGLSSDMVASDLSSHCTEINIQIYSRQYGIANILNCGINGNSLPLNICKETNEDLMEDETATMYHSFVEPSMTKMDFQNLSSNQLGYYSFTGYCFGTDSQSFDLMTMTDTTIYYGCKHMLSVIYYGNGITTEDGDQYFLEKKRMDSGDTCLLDEKLMGNMFKESETMIFIGWSKTRNPKYNDMKYVWKKENQTVSISDFNSRGQLKLYACWVVCDWNKSHTELELEV